MNTHIGFELVSNTMKKAHLTLEEQVQEFLDAGGKITSLKMGETQYPDGKLPPAQPAPKKTNNMQQKTYIERQEQYSVPVPKEKVVERKVKNKSYEERRKEERREASAKRKLEREAAARQAKTEREAARQAEAEAARQAKIDEKNKKDQLRKAKLALREYEAAMRAAVINDEVQRKESNRKARDEAVKANKLHYEAVCKHHGLTRFQIAGEDNQYCTECSYKNRKSKLSLLHTYPRPSERYQANQSLLNIALSNGETDFLGHCTEHGHTLFSLKKYGKNKNGYCCVTCRNRFRKTSYHKKQSRVKKLIAPKKVKAPKIKPVKQRVTKLVVYSLLSMCRKENVRLKNEAIQSGLTQYEGCCIKHGYSPMNLWGGRSECRKCKYEKSHVSKLMTFEEREADLNRQSENRNRMLKALEKIPFSNQFIGVCKQHGESAFYLKPSNNTDSNYSYSCMHCQLINAKRTELKKSKA